MELNKAFTYLVVNSLPEEVRELLQRVGPKLMVAGGFVRDVITNAEPKDIDLWTRGSLGMDIQIADDFDWTEKYSRSRTPHAITLKNSKGGPDIQFILRGDTFRFDHMNTLLNFDFSICQAGVYFDPDKGWVGIATESFLEDLPAFKARYNLTTDSEIGSTVLRMLKFAGMGFTIDRESVEQILARFVTQLEPNRLNAGDALAAVKNVLNAPSYSIPAPTTEEVPF